MNLLWLYPLHVLTGLSTTAILGGLLLAWNDGSAASDWLLQRNRLLWCWLIVSMLLALYTSSHIPSLPEL